MSSRALLAGLVLMFGCADFGRGGPSPDAGTPGGGGGGGGGTGDGGEAPSFAADAHALLISGCQSCHRNGGAAGDTGFVLSGDVEGDYLEALSFVDASNPGQSRLLRKAAGAGHGGGAIYAEGSPEYQSLLAWVSGGAQP